MTLSFCGIYAHSKWYKKALLLVSLAFFFLFFSSSLVFLIQKIGNIAADSAAWMLCEQAIVSILTFVGSTWFWAYLTQPNWLEFLGLTQKSKKRLYVIASFALFSILPVVNITAIWNEQLTLPASLQAIETLMRQMEDAANEATLTMLSPNGIFGWIAVVFVVAFLAALGEELLFRGGIQKGIEKKTGNLHLAVWCSALLFSFIHFQFYGFVPRLILGVVLGYFYAYSGSLRISIWAHFLNNFMSIVYYKLIVIPTEELYAHAHVEVIQPDSQTAAIIGDLDQKVADSMSEWMLYVAAGCLMLYVLWMLLFVFVARNRKAQ